MRGMLLLVLAVAMAGGCASAPPPVAGPSGPVTDPLQPGDMVRLDIWREPELTGEFQVDQRGYVTLPKLGPVATADRSPVELETVIREGLERYLRNPSIQVVLLRRVNILGQVGQPGLYPVDPTMTVADALAAAGGSLPNAAADRVEVIRGDQRIATRVTQRTRIADLGIRSGDQLYVPERGWWSRNMGVVATVAATVVSGTISLIIAFSN